MRIEEGRPTVLRVGQIEMPVESFELFRRVATDAMATLDLAPVPASGRRPRPAPRPREPGLCDTPGRDHRAGRAGRRPTRLPPLPSPPRTSSRRRGARSSAARTRPVRGGAVDSRLVTPGCLFVALPGERTDGHRFLAAAAAAGAAALLVTVPPDAAGLAALGDVTVVLVADALAGLQAVAAAWRARFAPLVVGVTGSVAKTSTKDATAAVLGAAMPTLRTEGNQNNEVGLPLTLLRLGPEHRAAVLEMGMYVGGEIADAGGPGPAVDRDRDGRRARSTWSGPDRSRRSRTPRRSWSRRSRPTAPRS